MKNLRWIAPMLMGLLLFVLWVNSGVEAQGPILPLAEPRPDPIVFLPAATKDAILRLSGIYTTTQFSPVATPPVIEVRLHLIDPNGRWHVTNPSFIKVIENQAAPGQFAFHMVLTLDQYGFFGAGEVGAAAISLRANNSAVSGALRGYMTAGVYVEETSAVNPLLAPYAAWLAEPRPDPVFSLPH